MSRYRLGGSIPDCRLDPPDDPPCCEYCEEWCNQDGVEDGGERKECPRCKGDGCVFSVEGDEESPVIDCPDCEGEGGWTCHCACHDGYDGPDHDEKDDR